jgi:signal transduction histidine kinase
MTLIEPGLWLKRQRLCPTDWSINEDCPKSREIKRTLGLLQQNADSHNHATERLTSITRSLTNFLRLDESDYQQFDVHEGLESTLTLLDHALRDRITVHKHYGDIPDIYGYPARLNQVFMNLLTNAIQSSRIPVRSPSGPRRMINGSP